VDNLHVIAAWAFVAFRALHSAIHCTLNAVMARFAVYTFSCLALFFMIFRAAIEFYSV
jgi:hypothetical protein